MKPPHIFTLTGNLLAERTLEFEHWSPGHTHRAGRETFQVGGKGINVAKMLNRLDVSNTALCFTGGAPGAECDAWLRERAFAFRAFATATPTRVGIVVRSLDGKMPETTFLGPDAPPDATATMACAEFLDAQPDAQVLAICGSFPGWSSAQFAPLHAALARWLDRGHLVVDTYGPPLADLATRSVALLKINADELRSLPSMRPDELPLRAERVIITDGPRAIRIRDGQNEPIVIAPPAIREVSATGSGDVLLACVVEALFVRKLSLEQAVAFAIPYAAANAAHPGIAEFQLPANDANGRE